jgi:hypothetical protein
MTWMAVGRPDSALARLSRNADLALSNTVDFWLPSLDALRQEPEFTAALRKVNLEGRMPQRTPRTIRPAP